MAKPTFPIPPVRTLYRVDFNQQFKHKPKGKPLPKPRKLPTLPPDDLKYAPVHRIKPPTARDRTAKLPPHQLLCELARSRPFWALLVAYVAAAVVLALDIAWWRQ